MAVPDRAHFDHSLLVFHAMNWLDMQITRDDIVLWLAAAQSYAMPRLLQTLGQVALGLVVFVVTRAIIKRVLGHFASRTASKLDDHIVEVLQRCVSISIWGWIAWRVGFIWDLPNLANFVVAVWIVSLSFPLSDFIAKILRAVEEEIVPKTETTLDDTALPLLNKVIRFVVIAGGVVMALSRLGVEIMPFVAGASVLGVAIGFAAKDTLSNLIAGVLLIMDRPFHIGDRIELWTAPQGTATWGDVIEIGLRATKIRNSDNLIFVIPNNEIMRRDIVNYTASGDNIRLRIPIGIAYDADSDLAKQIIRDVALGVEGVQASPEPQVIIRNFGESSIDMQLRVWIDDARRRRTIGDEITDKVKVEFDRQGVEIPYAKRDLYIRMMPDKADKLRGDDSSPPPENEQSET